MRSTCLSDTEAEGEAKISSKSFPLFCGRMNARQDCICASGSVSFRNGILPVSARRTGKSASEVPYFLNDSSCSRCSWFCGTNCTGKVIFANDVASLYLAITSTVIDDPSGLFSKKEKTRFGLVMKYECSSNLLAMFMV